MKAGTHAIEVQAQLLLSRRELQLLHHAFSYDQSRLAHELAETCQSSYFAGGVTKAEVVELFKSIRDETGKLIAQIEDAKTTLFKNT